MSPYSVAAVTAWHLQLEVEVFGRRAATVGVRAFRPRGVPKPATAETHRPQFQLEAAREHYSPLIVAHRRRIALLRLLAIRHSDLETVRYSRGHRPRRKSSYQRYLSVSRVLPSQASGPDQFS